MTNEERNVAYHRLEMQELKDKEKNPIYLFFENCLYSIIFIVFFGWLFLLIFGSKK
jgi:hypothetical protein